MQIISLREFRTKQGFYVDKVRAGEDIILKTRDNFSMKLAPVAPDDALMSKEEFYANIELALKEAQEGKVVRMTPELRAEWFAGL